MNDKFAPARFALTKKNKEVFLTTLKGIKVPDGYSSNISRCVDLSSREPKISGLKSHDYHVLLQQFLPLAVKYTLPEDVSMVLAELSFILRQLCAKVLDRQELDDLQTRVVLMLCRMEMIFLEKLSGVSVGAPKNNSILLHIGVSQNADVIFI